MGYFECCHGCMAPKRYPGCSGKCPEYAEAKKKYENDKAATKVDNSLHLYKSIGILRRLDKEAKNKKKYHPYRHM